MKQLLFLRVRWNGLKIVDVVQIHQKDVWFYMNFTEWSLVVLKSHLEKTNVDQMKCGVIIIKLVLKESLYLMIDEKYYLQISLDITDYLNNLVKEIWLLRLNFDYSLTE